jgi:superoxide dismutase, Cu-Zn family
MRPTIAIAAAAAMCSLMLLSCAQTKAPSSTPAATPSPGAPAATAPEAPSAQEGAVRAYARIEPKSDSRVKGKAEFVQEDGKVTFTLEVSGLTPGEHAIHLHDKGDCSAADGTSAGGHWNPTNEAHGKWGAHPFHRGDIGNLTADADGKATLNFTTDLWSVGGDPSRDVVGHAIIIHAKADDFTTQPTGNAGGRVACGVVVARR